MPQNHFLRKLERVLDLTFVYEETADLYSRKYGRSPIAPVVIVKYLLVGFLYGIPSERQIVERCADSCAFRWYLGINLDEQVPDHSTISQQRRRKPAFRKVFRRLFEEVVRQLEQEAAELKEGITAQAEDGMRASGLFLLFGGTPVLTN